MATIQPTTINFPTEVTREIVESLKHKDSICSDDSPRSCDSGDSSSLTTTPRGKLLWDHGYDVNESAKNVKTFEEREMEWRKFNKTDDDKLQDDNQKDFEKELQADDENVAMDINTGKTTTCAIQSNNLPDLVSSMASSFVNTNFITSEDSTEKYDKDQPVTGRDNFLDNSLNVCPGIKCNSKINSEISTVAFEDADDLIQMNGGLPPPLPSSNPPTLRVSESPPPLPDSDPPDIKKHAGELQHESHEENADYHSEEKEHNVLIAMINNESKSAILPKELTSENKVIDTIIDTTVREKKSHDTGDNFKRNNSDTSYQVTIDAGETLFQFTRPSKEFLPNDDNNLAQEENQENLTQCERIDMKIEREDLPKIKNSMEEFYTKAEKAFDEIINTTECLDNRIASEYKKCQTDNNFEEKDQFDIEVEAEFEAIINALDLNYMDETYVERFADRRDRYGFILSPVIEAPSPTPSSLSGYSGLSSVSPDPLSMFRMSPRPGSRTDLDLSSLGIDSLEWDLSLGCPVPIYQTVQAKRAVVIPDGYGWESGDDILSGSGEWEVEDGALKSPPISITGVNLSQFGSHVVGWKRPDTVIVEEPESLSEEESDSDETINGDVESPSSIHQNTDNYTEHYLVEKGSENDSDDDSNEEMDSTLEDVLGILTEFTSLPTEQSLDILSNGISQVAKEINSLREQTGGYSEELQKETYEPLSTHLDPFNSEIKQQDNRKQPHSLEASASDISFIYHRTNSNVSNPTSDWRSTPDDFLDAEDEMSDTDELIDKQPGQDEDGNSDSEFFLNKRKSLQNLLLVANERMPKDNDEEQVQVSEIISPRTAVLLRGGMFPMQEEESTSSSPLESDTDKETDSNEKSICNLSSKALPFENSDLMGVKVTQLTSDDSDFENYHGITNESNSSPKFNNIVSFRGKYSLNSNNCSPKEIGSKRHFQEDGMDSASSTPTVKIVSPLDLDIFGGKVERPSLSDGGRSPRVLGRYYSEMDEDVVAQSLSPPTTGQSAHDILCTSVPESYDTHIKDEKDDNGFKDDQFQDVEFSRSTLTNIDIELRNNENEISEDSSSDTTESPDILIVNEFEKEVLSNEENPFVSMDTIRLKREDEQGFSIDDQILIKDKKKNPPVKKSINKRNAKMNQRRPPVQIKVSNLKRKDSLRSKIKKGFVHQISEIFSKKHSKETEEVNKNRDRKPRRSELDYVSLPELLTPNENIVIRPKSLTLSDSNDSEDTKGGSLGFEVSPLQVISETNYTDIDLKKMEENKHTDDSKNTYPRSETLKDLEKYGSLADNIREQKNLVPHISRTIDRQNCLKESGEFSDTSQSTESEVNKYTKLLQELQDSVECAEDNAIYRLEASAYWQECKIGVYERNNQTNIPVEKELCSLPDIQSNILMESSCKSPFDDFRLFKRWAKTNCTESSSITKDRGQAIGDLSLYKKWTDMMCIDHSSKELQLRTLGSPMEDKRMTENAKSQVEQKQYTHLCKHGDARDDPKILNESIQKENKEVSSEEKLVIHSPRETGHHAKLERKRTSPKESYNTCDYTVVKEKIQYPPSLSRRLYGPYIRQKQKSPLPTVDLPKNSEEREITPAPLSSSSTELESCQILNALITVKSTDRRQSTHLLNLSDTKEMPYNNTDENLPTKDSLSLNEGCVDTLPIQTDSKLDANNTTLECPGQNVNLSYTGDVFQHTLYKVDIPVTNPPTQGNVPFNLKTITHRVGNEAKHLYHSENNFANANIRSGDWSRAVNIDVNDRNIQPVFSVVNSYHDRKPVELSVNSFCDRLLNTLDFNNECDDVLFNERKSVNSVLKNGIFPDNMGVSQTAENITCDDTRESEKMRQNGPLMQAACAESKFNSLSINDPTSTLTVTVNQAYMSTGKDVSRGENSQVNDRRKNSPSAWTRDKQVSVVVLPPDCQHVLEDEKGNVKVWPYSDFDNSDKLQVTLHKAKSRRKVLPFKGMNDNSSNMTIIQSAEHSAEMPENRMVKRYQTSSVLPVDNSDKSVTQTHADSIKTVLLQDANGNMVSEKELAKILPKIAENIANMETTDAEEILPGITQSVTKLRNGGNLVITTMTRKLDEIESDSSGRGSPEPSHPVLNVDDLDNSKIYLVEDSNGELFYVEDITSETQESAYFSSSRNTSESVSDGANSPTFKRISKIHQVGESGINSSTAEEILSAMYNGENVHEMTENEEEWSERTYEYDLPRRRNEGRTNGYSKDTFNTSYVVEEPDTIPRTKTISKDRFETSYEMAENEPWITDGGQMQSYSQATQVQGLDRTDGTPTVDTTDYSMRMNTRQNASGIRTQESYTVEAEANVYPMVPYQYPIIQTPVFIPPAPVCIPAEIPQYSLVKVDVKPEKEESVMSRVDVTEHNKIIEIDERPIFKTVAHIQTGEKHPPVKRDMTEKKKYKIVSTKASNVNEEEQESHMSFGELDYRYTTENVEIKKSPTLQTKQFFVRDSSKIEQQKLKSEQRFRSEKTIDLGSRKPDIGRNNTTTIEVKRDYPMNDVETYEERTYSYDQMKATVEPVDSNMRVIRGSYLIKNNLEEVDVALDDNINMFDGNFVLSKENPLYQSDEDIYKKFEREKAEHAQKQDRFQRDYRQDMTFETVDKFSKSKNVKREAAKSKQSVTELLLEKLSTIDSKDIHQRIDVKHHAEDIYGDPRFLHADGSSVRPRGTNDFDTVGEKVDLLLKEGKAYITVKVTAERITPVDLEFNVWRKNQAIVTRIIEVDLLATEQRRRLYYKVMEEQDNGTRGLGRRGYLAGPNETILDGHQTLDLFSRILGAAEGEGDKEDITVKTKLTNTTRPFSSGMDLLY